MLLTLTVHFFAFVAFGVDTVPDASAGVARQVDLIVE